METRLQRSSVLLGEEGISKLKKSSVLLFGVGGVGSFAAEALARAGIGNITLVDSDTVNESNINRQLVALSSTVGRLKTEVMAERIRDINPEINVTVKSIFYTAESAGEIDFSEYDYVIDAIDTVSSKLLIAELCRDCGTPLISSMGTGNKLDPTAFRVCDISETSGCPLARVMRREVKKRGIEKLTVVFSPETPKKNGEDIIGDNGRPVPGSVSFVPSTAGLILAGKVIRDLSGVKIDD